METRKFPIEFPVYSSFCLGEPGGSRRISSVILVYSFFGLLHFNQSQVLENDDAKPDCIYRAFGELSRFSTACSVPYFRCFVAKFAVNEYSQDTKHYL